MQFELRQLNRVISIPVEVLGRLGYQVDSAVDVGGFIFAPHGSNHDAGVDVVQEAGED